MIKNDVRLIGKKEFLKLKEEYIDLLNQDEFHVYYVDGKNIRTFNDASRIFKDEYAFADYYGHNWDAFTDCMQDLDFWDDKHGFVLVIYNMKKCFKNDLDEKKIFLSCLECVAYYLEKECLTTSGGANHIKSFDVYLVNEDISHEI